MKSARVHSILDPYSQVGAIGVSYCVKAKRKKKQWLFLSRGIARDCRPVPRTKKPQGSSCARNTSVAVHRVNASSVADAAVEMNLIQKP